MLAKVAFYFSFSIFLGLNLTCSNTFSWANEESQAEKDLDQLLFDIILSMNIKEKDGLPLDQKKLLPSNLFNCWQTEDKLVEFCLNHLVIDTEIVKKRGSSTNDTRKTTEKQSPPPLILADCMITLPETADNVTGKIAKLNNLKMPIFLSRLSDSQKISAASDLQKCTSVEFIWPQPFTQYKGAEMYIAEALNNTWTVDDWMPDLPYPLIGGSKRSKDFYRTIIEAFVCLTKALVENGCSSIA